MEVLEVHGRLCPFQGDGCQDRQAQTPLHAVRSRQNLGKMFGEEGQTQTGERAEEEAEQHIEQFFRTGRPYRDGGWLKKILSALTGQAILKSSGLLVMEQSAHVPAVSQEGWQQLKRRVYGETQINYMALAGNRKIIP